MTVKTGRHTPDSVQSKVVVALNAKAMLVAVDDERRRQANDNYQSIHRRSRCETELLPRPIKVT